ncbi:hypothetical protein FHS43_001670 [Streptosporangium becharense]|uniref:Sulfotransferase family protein n=1 Tax=Streptosporangium becharense TaxID=1816182 RepID=A0A7W9MJK1_9ACTN|nr:sulfotransferase family protein [Streptosporangium becharense]MBB2910407.1 hypothetical protein [Streptosporangium becharense]MBB5823150.1 hypothetical protein [Streptosporangium becharense]
MSGRLLMLWSAPRSRSTMFLRMMLERGDFLVVHEPFSHVVDFGRAEVAGTVCADEEQVITRLLAAGRERQVFSKDTTDFHYPAVLRSRELLTEAVHTFIVRHPREVIASHYGLNPALTRDEVGFARLREIHDAVADATGRTPVVIDADDLVSRPEETVRAYCRATGIPFLAHALRWEPVAVPAWRQAERWHLDVMASDGIRRGVSSRPAVDVEDHPVLGAFYRFHLPHYRALWEHRLTPQS